MRDPEIAGAGEILPVFVERAGHDAIRRVEGLLDAVAVMHIDVDIQDPLRTRITEGGIART